ncbi:MAG: phosphopantetheine-binding protein [Adhaeribacter sp.]
MHSNNYSAIYQEVAQLIYAQKGIRVSRLLTKSFDQLGLDLVDLIDIILAVEKKYKITIPDEVPLNSVNDFVYFILGKNVSNPVVAKV